MAAIFVDIDGTTMEWGTENFLPGALDELRRFREAGHQIIFTTQRKQDDRDFNMAKLRELIALYFPESTILYHVTSPRIVMNDAGAIAINHPRDGVWNYDLLSLAAEK
jgi:ribonucleotide monophosphatase NagD (HAD superfamily)